MRIPEILAQAAPAGDPTAGPVGGLSSTGPLPHFPYAQLFAGTIHPAPALTEPASRDPHGERPVVPPATIDLEREGDFTSTVPTSVVLAPPVLAAVVAFDGVLAGPAAGAAVSDVAAPAGFWECLRCPAAPVAAPADQPQGVVSETGTAPPPDIPPDGLRQILTAAVPGQPSVSNTPTSQDRSAEPVAEVNRQPAATGAQPLPTPAIQHGDGSSSPPSAGPAPHESGRSRHAPDLIAGITSPPAGRDAITFVEQPGSGRPEPAAISPALSIDSNLPGLSGDAGEAREVESADAARSSRPQGTSSTAAGVTSGGHRAESSAMAQQTTVLSPQTDPAGFADRLARALLDSHQAGRPLQIRLHPPELGALQIELSRRDGAFTARLDVETPAARQAILEQLPQLREAFVRAGHQIERIDVHLLERHEDRPQHGDRRHGFAGSDGDDARRQDDRSSGHRFDEETAEPARTPHHKVRPPVRPGTLEQLDIQI